LVQAIAFYAFAFVTIAAGVMVVSSRNPVHSVLYLILAFFNAAGLFVLIGAEFIAMILVVVYVGAVAVLFLFVVMMLDINFVELRQGFMQYLPIGALLGLILLVELFFVIGIWSFSEEGSMLTAVIPVQNITNTHALGNVLYTNMYICFKQQG
jgi:NADH-quinone oxidoreductase subunit J